MTGRPGPTTQLTRREAVQRQRAVATRLQAKTAAPVAEGGQAGLGGEGGKISRPLSVRHFAHAAVRDRRLTQQHSRSPPCRNATAAAPADAIRRRGADDRSSAV